MKSVFSVSAYWSWVFCVAFIGCGDNELAEVNFIRSDLPTGSTVHIGLSYIELFFDGTPQAVTVNGMPARVENTTAIFEFRDWLAEGDIKLAVEWLNKDGSEGKGTVIRYKVIHGSYGPPLIVDSTVHPGDTVYTDRINRWGITIIFAKDVRPGSIEIRPEGGKPLNWIAEWRSGSVTITPRDDGDKLLPGKSYVIEITGVTHDVTGLRDEAIESSDFRLQFSTKE